MITKGHRTGGRRCRAPHHFDTLSYSFSYKRGGVSHAKQGRKEKKECDNRGEKVASLYGVGCKARHVELKGRCVEKYTFKQCFNSDQLTYKLTLKIINLCCYYVIKNK